MMTSFRGKTVEIDEIVHCSDPVDSFIRSAYWLEKPEEGKCVFLTDAELDELTEEKFCLIHDDWFDHQIDRAEFLVGCRN